MEAGSSTILAEYLENAFPIKVSSLEETKLKNLFN